MTPVDSSLTPDASMDEVHEEETISAAVARESHPVKKYAKMMLYTHPKVARKIKQIALDRERKANDIILDALDLYFAKNGHTSIKHVIES